jgi:hypothetical protein
MPVNGVGTDVADAADVLGGGAGAGLAPAAERLPWRRAWADLMLPRLDRVTRHFAWRLLPADDGLSALWRGYPALAGA